MTTSTTAQAVSNAPVESWLLPSPGEARLRLDRIVQQAGTPDERRVRPLRALGTVARRALAEEIEAKLRAFMNDTLADVIVGGWRAYGAVAQAIRKSHSQPGVDLIVPLRKHTISAARQHSLDIEVDGFRVMTLSVEVDIRVQLIDAVAVVRDGHLVAVRSGRAAAAGTVTVDKVALAHRTLTFPLTAELMLRAPSADRTGTNTSPGHRLYQYG